MRAAMDTGPVAGAIYFLSAIAAGVSLIYVPGTLIVDGDADATARHVMASDHLFRACIASELIGALLLVVVVRILFQLLHGTNDRLARLMVTLVLLSVPITFVNVLTEIAALDLDHGTTTLASSLTALAQPPPLVNNWKRASPRCNSRGPEQTFFLEVMKNAKTAVRIDDEDKQMKERLGGMYHPPRPPLLM